ncbi:MAG: hypothetical protein WBB28_10240 [Crinalium sp.]
MVTGHWLLVIGHWSLLPSRLKNTYNRQDAKNAKEEEEYDR